MEKRFYTKLIENTIKNQLFQHGHEEYKSSDYNPKLDVGMSAEITWKSIEENFNYVMEKQRKEFLKDLKELRWYGTDDKVPMAPVNILAGAHNIDIDKLKEKWKKKNV